MEWTEIWSDNQQDYRSWPSKIWNDHQQIRIALNHTSESIRIKFSNKYGIEPIIFSSVTVCCDSKPQPVLVSVLGERDITILPGTELLSEPIEYHIQPKEVLQIDTFLAAPVALTGGIVHYSTACTQVKNKVDQKFEEQVNLFRMVSENHKMQYIYGISGVYVPKKLETNKIVFFGDSLIQQGYIVDQVKQLFLEKSIRNTAVINRGIGGSRILSGTDSNFDPYNRHGLPGLYRFEKEVFSEGEVDAVIILHGINDILTAKNDSGKSVFSTINVIKGLKQYAEIAHSHGVRCFVGTLMPFRKSIFFSEELEGYRQEINHWIRNNSSFDRYFDFDRAVCLDEDPSQLSAIYDSGDGLHLNDRGGRKVAETIELQLILKEKN
ncbi:hypothetical protein IGI37_000730 [Enterococcus sp. AZ194]|uniref:GDSL-type esterase/lipase family protein n=1 Tax=Enterococcus sp. AZ194 TaxID=2774629 RepID=UPI003F23DEDA